MDPIQTKLANAFPRVELRGWKLERLARFKIQARVLGTKSYANSETALLAPLDLALGWGVMADDAVLGRLEITQSDRFYHWKWWGAAPLPEEELIRHSTNAHIIPANEKIAKQLEQVKVGDWVELEGALVEATHPTADKPWRSSLVRDDRGEGACEIILVESFQHISGRSGKL
ncbi:hypothetical protein FEM03_01710 [Phragmitibacter flavus]|uniref:Uncharacterized protein n=1 Tax=Phragmitibacter flavus TaxID=2576071 RepID=A0A5R8KKF5_9BACT|nr:hypothetical protein [Phragmitibacter flavus]TLD72813.1 hypothetical protein FEM03_01710 [Phragmitibacter flavus]